MSNKKLPTKIYELRKYFEKYIKIKKLNLDVIKKITLSLFISLIPLHENINPEKILRFVKKIEKS